jgi:hypothetical protein
MLIKLFLWGDDVFGYGRKGNTNKFWQADLDARCWRPPPWNFTALSVTRTWYSTALVPTLNRLNCKDSGPKGPVLVHTAGVIWVITFASSVQVSGVRKQFEVEANFVDVEGIGENIGANDSRRKAAQAAIPKTGFL